MKYFSYFFQKIGFDISCKLSLQFEWNLKAYFGAKVRKISVCHPLSGKG